MTRQNTHLESEGAEFLVLGNLLTLGIPSYKTYNNMPGDDITAKRGQFASVVAHSGGLVAV